MQSELIQAAQNRDTARLRAVLVSGVDVNAPSESGRTALEYAVAANYEVGVCLLLQHGAAVPHSDVSLFPSSVVPLKTRDESAGVFDGNSLLFLLAIANESAAIADMLYTQFICSLPDALRQPLLCEALFIAVETERPKCVEYVLNLGADLECRSKYGDTPLIVAAAYGAADVVRLLLDYGADINGTTRLGYNALMNALENGYEDAALYILDRGADVTTRASDRSTALSTAKKRKLRRVIARLKELGA